CRQGKVSRVAPLGARGRSVALTVNGSYLHAEGLWRWESQARRHRADRAGHALHGPGAARRNLRGHHGGRGAKEGPRRAADRGVAEPHEAFDYYIPVADLEPSGLALIGNPEVLSSYLGR